MIHRKTFSVNIFNTSLHDESVLRVFHILNVAWNLSARKNTRNGQEYLGVYFVQKKNAPIKEDSVPIIVKFRLISFIKGQPDLEYECDQYSVNSTTGWRIFKKSFIPWEHLVGINTAYVSNDTIDLEVTIEDLESDIVFDDAEVFDGKDGKVRFTITNIDNLEAVQSPPLKIRQLNCNLTVYKSDSNTLRVRFGSESRYQLNRFLGNGCIRVKLMSTKGNKSSIRKMKNERFNNFNELHEIEMISWEQLTNAENGFVSNKSITMEVKVHKSKSDSSSTAGPSISKIKCFICLGSIEGENIARTQHGHPICSVCNQHTASFSM